MRTIGYLLSFLLIFALIGCEQQSQKDIAKKPPVQQKGGGADDTDDGSIAPDESGPDSHYDRVPLPEGDCGGMEIDPATGERIIIPNVDLVVAHVEIFTTDLGTWVRPTIRNICGDAATGQLEVFIQSDNEIDVGLITTAMINVPGHLEFEWAYALGVPEGTNYTVEVNWDRNFREANYSNNRCVRSSTGDCS